MSETALTEEEVKQKLLAKNHELLAENQTLLEEVDRLTRELKKNARELRISNSFLDKVTKASEAKETLNSALSEANIKQRAYTDMLLQSCPSIIILLDGDGRFVLSTEALMTALNTPNFDYIKNRKYEEVFFKYFSSDGIEAFKAAFNKALNSNEVIRFDSLVDFAQTGQPRFYSFELRRAGAGLNNKDNYDISGILAIMIDFTDLMHEKQRAEAANNAKSDFLATMSHEIRTPMNAIIGMSEMLDRSELSSKQKKYISDIRKSSSSLLAIINDILDFSKIEAGKMEIVNENFNLKMLLDNLHSMFFMLCREKQLKMNFTVSEDFPDTIFGDETRFRQILTNLLSNAVKYTKQGGVSFSASIKEEELRFEIKDTGMGIRDEDKSKLFKPFEQLDVRKNRNVIGTGLGLAITYNLCHIMGGALWFDSVYGEGSAFYASLPYALASQAVCETTSDVYEFSAPEAKILIVDDIEINLAVAEALLSAFDITPELALSGDEALELVKNNRYDIIFMDHMMPGMDGVETTKYIRELGGWANEVPIIALTANAITGVEQMFLENRMDDFLPKPIDINALNLCLSKWLPSSVIKG